MNKNPFFSIIVPVYKTEQYIHQCVESILSQTYTDFEAVLVDDGSPDNCGSICDEYAERDSRIKVVHKRNGGLVSARKAGLKECRGEYIINVDSDDYISADLLERLFEIVKEYHPEAVMFGYNQFDEKLQVKMKPVLTQGYYVGDTIKQIRDNLIIGKDGGTVIYNCVWSMTFKREVYFPYQNSVPEKISRGEDLAVTAPILSTCSSVYITDYCGYFYRNNPTSIMNVFKTDEIDRIKILINYLSDKLDDSYKGRLNAYILLEYYRFLSSAIAVYNYREYKNLIKSTLDTTLCAQLKKARCGEGAHVSNKIVFWIFRYRLFALFWIIMKARHYR